MEPESTLPASEPTPFGELPYEGFLTPSELWDQSFAPVPKFKGIYQVLWNPSEKPRFLDQSPAGRFKGRDPSKPRDELKAKWVEGASALFIAAAGGSGAKATLRSRIRSMIRFGRGESVGHWNGHSVWQLVNPEDLVIAWTSMRSEPGKVERELLEKFEEQYGALPFAH